MRVSGGESPPVQTEERVHGVQTGKERVTQVQRGREYTVADRRAPKPITQVQVGGESSHVLTGGERCQEERGREYTVQTVERGTGAEGGEKVSEEKIPQVRGGGGELYTGARGGRERVHWCSRWRRSYRCRRGESTTGCRRERECTQVADGGERCLEEKSVTQSADGKLRVHRVQTGERGTQVPRRG
uniref:Uncharacterized protein n=1 Tax=Knipowitschia caucasica TaxID=637954 RepID=A0AAV2JMA5_KNICA